MLTTISKIIEKRINSRLNYFLDLHKLITPRQFAFRRHCGTEDATPELTS